MSEEEIIEIVNEIKNHQIAIFEPKENIQITRNYFSETQRQAIQGLLDLYNKEKEKNKILTMQIIENERLYNKETARLGNLIKELLEE